MTNRSNVPCRSIGPRVVGAVAALVLLAACAGGGNSKTSSTTLPITSHGPVIDGGDRFSVELTAAGRVLAWGHNSTGELGDGTEVLRPTPAPVRGLPAGLRIVSVSAGANHVLALGADGSVWAWGHNRSGQLGDGSKVDRPAPIRVKGLHDARAVSAGNAFSVALEADGSVFAWGNNQSGQLGDGNAPEDHITPELVHGLGKGSGVVQIASGKSHILVRKSDGSLFGWGNGTSGQLGDGANTKKSAPGPVIGLGPNSGVISIAAGGSHSLALKADGTVFAWGNNKSGQLGNGTRPADQNRPVSVKGLSRGSGVIAIAAGASFSVALERDGTVVTWGKNKVGELGNGTTRDSSVPVKITSRGSGPVPTAVATGAYHALALRDDGTVIAWGDNSSGQLGSGAVSTDSTEPVAATASKSTP